MGSEELSWNRNFTWMSLYGIKTMSYRYDTVPFIWNDEVCFYDLLT